MTRRRLLASFAALGLAARDALAVETHTYAAPDRSGIPPRVDVHGAPGARAAVVVVHGGAFVVGSRERRSVRACAAALNAVGLTALALDYRLLGRGGRLDEAVADVRACMDWWRGAAPGFGADPDRLGLMGLSAGGALAAIAASEGAARAWVGVYGPYDFRRLPGQPVTDAPTRWLLGTDEPERWLDRSPLLRADAAIPTLLFHGTRDRLVPIAHARSLVEARRRAGLPVELREVDAGHGYLQHPRSEVSRRTLAESSAFFADALRTGGS